MMMMMTVYFATVSQVDNLWSFVVKFPEYFMYQKLLKSARFLTELLKIIDFFRDTVYVSWQLSKV